MNFYSSSEVYVNIAKFEGIRGDQLRSKFVAAKNCVGGESVTKPSSFTSISQLKIFISRKIHFGYDRTGFEKARNI